MNNKPYTTARYRGPVVLAGTALELARVYRAVSYDFTGIPVHTSEYLTETKRVIDWKRTGGKTHTVTIGEATRPSRKVHKMADGSFLMHPAVYEELKRSVR
jgi:hypothetical protein